MSDSPFEKLDQIFDKLTKIEVSHSVLSERVNNVIEKFDRIEEDLTDKIQHTDGKIRSHQDTHWKFATLVVGIVTALVAIGALILSSLK